MGVKILSLYDGMACGMIAMQLAGVEVESYDAYEIDKYAIKTAQHNFPMIKEHGDVFEADFTQYEGVDFLIGGSPCTYWSIAQTKNRETVASGMGWELFSQYVRALHEAKPKYFIYENNKSMSKQIRASIDEAFGFEAVLINSALVSAQNRQRLYWVGKRNADGTYSRVNVEQPADRGILLKDVLDNAVAMREKAHAVIASAGRTTEREFFMKNQGNMVAEPVRGMGNDTKGRTLTANYWKTNVRDAFVDCAGGRTMVAEPINTDANGKAFCVTSRYYKGFGNNPGKCLEKHRDSMVAEPVECKTIINSIPEIAEKFGYVPEMFNAYNRAEITDKAPTLSTGSMATSSCAVNRFEDVCGYATLCEWDESGNPTKAVSAADGKTYTVYEANGGQITIKGKQYPIKLKDGYYIIRKLTVSECKRLQTVPEWYEFPVSNSQAYKMLGNGWTCEVIAHLIRSCYGRTVGRC